MRVRRSVLLGGLVAAAVVAGAASYAFACSANATLEALSPSEGAKGSEVTVSSRQWQTDTSAVPSAVEIRWGSATGPLLATTVPAGDGWSIKVTIPEGEPDSYQYIVALSRSSGRIVIEHANTFHFVAAAPSATQPAGTATAPTNAGPQAASPAQASEPAPSNVGPVATSQAAGSTAAASASTPSSPAVATGSAPTAVSGASAVPVGSATSASGPQAAAKEAHAAVPAGVAAGPAPTPRPLAPAPATEVTQVSPAPDPADHWATPAPVDARPSLISEVPPDGNGVENGLAVALMAVGTLGLFATGLVMAVSRRRAAAQSTSR